MRKADVKRPANSPAGTVETRPYMKPLQFALTLAEWIVILLSRLWEGRFGPRTTATLGAICAIHAIRLAVLGSRILKRRSKIEPVN